MLLRKKAGAFKASEKKRENLTSRRRSKVASLSLSLMMSSLPFLAATKGDTRQRQRQGCVTAKISGESAAPRYDELPCGPVALKVCVCVLCDYVVLRPALDGLSWLEDPDDDGAGSFVRLPCISSVADSGRGTWDPPDCQI